MISKMTYFSFGYFSMKLDSSIMSDNVHQNRARNTLQSQYFPQNFYQCKMVVVK
jgi:hypothetical protein